MTRQPKAWTPFRVGVVIVYAVVSLVAVFYVGDRWPTAFHLVYWLVFFPVIVTTTARRWMRDRRYRREEANHAV